MKITLPPMARHLRARPALAAALVTPVGKKGGRPWPPPSLADASAAPAAGPPVMSFKRLLDQLAAVWPAADSPSLSPTAAGQAAACIGSGRILSFQK
jgi:hypothetical protein